MKDGMSNFARSMNERLRFGSLRSSVSSSSSSIASSDDGLALSLEKDEVFEFVKDWAIPAEMFSLKEENELRS